MNAHDASGQLLVGLAVIALLGGCAGGATVAPSSTATTLAGLPAASAATTVPTTTGTPATAAPVATYGQVSSVQGTATCPTSPKGWNDTGTGSVFKQGLAYLLRCTIATNDARVSGTESSDAWQLTVWGPMNRGAGVQSGHLRLVNAGGTWEGTGSGVYSSDRGDIVVSWFKGTGGYAGLGYFELRSGMAPWAIRGLVFPGDPPNLAGIPDVTGPDPSPNVTDTPMPIPAATPRAIAYGPVSVVEGTSTYTYVDVGSGTYAGIDQVNDPRVSGTYLAPSWTTHFWGATGDSFGTGTQWGPTRLESADGAWHGTGSGILDEGGDVIAMWYTGSGSYTGLAYFELLGSPDMFDPTIPVDRYGVFGQVFPGAPPAP